MQFCQRLLAKGMSVTVYLYLTTDFEFVESPNQIVVVFEF